MPVEEVTGTVVYINAAHRYFRVEYTVIAPFGRVWVDHECFKLTPPPTKDPPEPFRGHYYGHHKGPRTKKENTP